MHDADESGSHDWTLCSSNAVPNRPVPWMVVPVYWTGAYRHFWEQICGLTVLTVQCPVKASLYWFYYEAVSDGYPSHVKNAVNRHI